MRAGRLQATTMSNIWKALEGIEPRESIQKQYIPTGVDSPLYRLIFVQISRNPNSSIMVEPESNSPNAPRGEEIQIAETEPNISFVVHGHINLRGLSVPNLETEPLEFHLPLPRVVQSTNDLFPEERQSERNSRQNLINRSLSSISICTAKDKKEDISKKNWEEEYAHIDIDWSMQAMDILYNASFYEYIRDERNVDLSAIRLSRIVKDYKPKQVATALLWMIQGWSVENSAKLFRIIFNDWLPDLAGCVYSLVTKNWPKKPQCALCTAYVLISEPATSTALFLRSLTQAWDRKESIDIITYLDSVLRWDSTYLQEVMTVYADVLYTNGIDGTSLKNPDFSNANIDLIKASKKLMLANARLAMAEYQLALFNHWSNCTKCQDREECDEIDKMAAPDFVHNKSFLEADSDKEESIDEDTSSGLGSTDTE